MKKITLLTLLLCLMSTFSFAQQVVINEIDADQTGTDTGEFIELKSTNANFSLNGYLVVLFNGNSDESYATYDLTGFTTDANGFLLLANDAFPGMDISLGADNGLQNGADAVAIYQASATSFPDGTLATTTGLIDALVYGTNDADDTGLLAALGETVQYDEAVNSNKDTESIQRNPADGTFCVGLPTPDAVNINCANTCPLVITITSVTCDTQTTGATSDTYTIVASFTGGGTETYVPTVVGGTIDVANSDDPSTSVTGTIIVNAVEGTDVVYTITSANCNIQDSVISPVCEPSSNVADIATLRQGTLGATYTLTGEAFLTYQQTFRGQKYIQDATAAILIDDNDGNITTTYAVGDGITGITGELSEFNGVMQFIPESDPGAATSTGNNLTIQTVTIADFNANSEDYESELIAFLNVSLTDADGTVTFATGTNYVISNGSETTTMRTQFFDADYIGQVIPTNQLSNIVGIASQFDNGTDVTPQIFPRDSNDFEANLLASSNTLTNVSIYPNPSNTGLVTIETASNEAAAVEVYNLLGKQVISQTLTNSTLNVANLSSGVYLVKVSVEGKSATKKLVIE
jgi:hypothetical protein